MPQPQVVVCGRAFSAEDLATIGAVIGAKPPLNRRQIATQSCELLGWTRPDGRLKEMSCRVALRFIDTRSFRIGHRRSSRPAPVVRV